MTDEATTTDPASIPFGSLGRPTAAQARAIWESMPEPSCQSCVDLMNQRGWRISKATLARWRLAEWKEPARNTNHNGGGKVSLAEKRLPRGIKKELKAEIGKLDEDGKSVAKGTDVAAILAKPTDEEALTKLMAEIGELTGDLKALDVYEIRDRTKAAMDIILMRRATVRADLLILIPKDTAAFINAMTEAVQGRQVSTLVPTDGENKMIDVTPNEVHPLSAAIHTFKRKVGQAA